MSLQNWLQIGHLSKHKATVAEVHNLLGVVDRELADGGVLGVSDDGRFRNAYRGSADPLQTRSQRSRFQSAETRAWTPFLLDQFA